MKRIILPLILIYLVIVNVVAFLLMLIDKKKAKKRRRRIPEAVLMGVGAIGGSIGAMAGMELFRHKTKHLLFRLGLPAIFIVQAGLVAAFYMLIMK